MVTGDKKLLPPIRRCEERGFRVVGSVGKKLQGQKRMRGAALSQINLDGIRLPFSVRAYHHKIQREPPDDSFFLDTPADLHTLSVVQRSTAGTVTGHTANT